MTVIPNGFAQANFKYTGDGLLTGGENTLGLDVQASAGTPLTIAEDLSVLWESFWAPSITSTVVLSSVLVKFGPDATGPSAEFPCNIPGEVGGAAASSAVCYLGKKITSLGGRAGRGRLYIPGVPESEVGPQGDLDDTWVGNFNTAMAGFMAGLNSADLPPVLLHGADSPLSVPTLIQQIVIDGMVATQRRRQRR